MKTLAENSVFKITADDIRTLVKQSKENLGMFYNNFVAVYPEFYHKLCGFEPKLSESEIKFCMFLKMNYSTKEIAKHTKVSVKSIECKKYRIRKKIDLAKGEDLYVFFGML